MDKPEKQLDPFSALLEKYGPKEVEKMMIPALRAAKQAQLDIIERAKAKASEAPPKPQDQE